VGVSFLEWSVLAVVVLEFGNLLAVAEGLGCWVRLLPHWLKVTSLGSTVVVAVG